MRRSLYRVVETRLGNFSIQRRGKLWGWTFVYNDRRQREIASWTSREAAENWVKGAIPQAIFRRRVLSEWFVDEEGNISGK